MAQASTYFYDGSDSGRQTLHRRIRPSETQFEEQQARWNALCDYLIPELKESSGYSMRSWLQGSYKFGTQIRPVRKGGEFDIDLGVYYCWGGSAEAGDYGPKTLKAFVQEALNKFAQENADVTKVAQPPKERCCRIHFEGEFHIDTPVYHLDAEEDLRSLATESDRWESSDPKALYLWFTSEFDNYRRDRVRRLTRYMKAWAALKCAGNSEMPSSVLLTILVAEAVSEMGDALPGPEDEAFQKIVSLVFDRISDGQDVRNPAERTENIAARMSVDGWNAFIEEVKKLHNLAENAVTCDSETEACHVWALAFEYLFPLPDVEDLLEESRNLPALRTLPEVQVHAVSKDNQRFRYSGSNQIGPIPKNCEIDFRVTNANAMPYGTQFFWTVRNEGDEAEDVNDLGHRAGIGVTATERSSYNGTHYMDCTAVAGDHIIGVRRIKVSIRDQRAPKRNPGKPSYVRLRGRR